MILFGLEFQNLTGMTELELASFLSEQLLAMKEAAQFLGVTRAQLLYREEIGEFKPDIVLKSNKFRLYFFSSLKKYKAKIDKLKKDKMKPCAKKKKMSLPVFNYYNDLILNPNNELKEEIERKIKKRFIKF